MGREKKEKGVSPAEITLLLEMGSSSSKQTRGKRVFFTHEQNVYLSDGSIRC